MADNTPSRADAFGGRRRRTFLAAAKPQQEAPPLPEEPLIEALPAAAGPVEEDDLPILTEEISPEAEVSEASPQHFDETLLSILTADLAHSIETRLAVELPSLIEATLDSFQQDLRRGVLAATEAALTDFIARRQQLRLPLGATEPAE
ncbi:MAG: hypothetical protein WAZ34_03430 [Rhodocyclaceae bacterium]